MNNHYGMLKNRTLWKQAKSVACVILALCASNFHELP
jgi:hypothetical protein